MSISAVVHAAQPLAGSRQCLVVVTDSWTAPAGKLALLERGERDSRWSRLGSTINVRVGRAGLARGRGLIDTTRLAGPIKEEGDDKAPAGVFRLGSVFGLARETKMPFVTLTENIVAVDDPHSRSYNQLVDQSKIGHPDWKHAEKMFGVAVYKHGVVVEHNIPAKPGAGSCIFLHIWESPSTSTSGCTAMPQKDLVKIIHWLDPALAPVLIQMPRPVYQQMRGTWTLPKL